MRIAPPIQTPRSKSMVPSATLAAVVVVAASEEALSP
jgi:hypothetical protein